MFMKIYFIYVTFKNINEAKKIGNLLVKNKLAACVNIHPMITSIYAWKNKIYNDKESSAIFKTTKSKVSKVINIITNNHSYDCPSISAFPIEKIHPKFKKWIIVQTKNSKA